MYGALDIVCAALSNVVIEAGRYSATEAGAALMPVPFLIAIPSSVIGALSGRIESRLPLAFGSLLVAADALLALRVDVLVEYWTTAVSALVVVAVGTSGVTASLASVVRGRSTATTSDRRRTSTVPRRGPRASSSQPCPASS